MTRERPIIFGAESVRAILAGIKTQTRRLVGIGNSFVDGTRTPRDHWNALDFTKAWVDPGPSPAGNPGPYLKAPCIDPVWHEGAVHRVYPWVFNVPEEPERLWVREAFQPFRDDVLYRADDEAGHIDTGWRSPIFLKRRDARLLLSVADVRVQRLGDISEEDAAAEGVDAYDGALDEVLICQHSKAMGACADDSRPWFAAAWDYKHGRGAWERDRSRWVWVVTFSRLDGGRP